MGCKQSRLEILEEAKRYTDAKFVAFRTKEAPLDELQTTKKAYDDLYAKHEALLNARGSISNLESQISDEAIDRFVKTLIDDPKTNIYGFPDVVESAVYRNVLKTMLHAVAHVTNDSNVLFLGHKIRIVIEPIKEELCGTNEDLNKEKFEIFERGSKV